METGKVVQWLVQPGAQVRSGDVVAVVETHKGAIDVEIFLDGIIEDLVPLDVELKVGALLAHVRVAGELAATAQPATPLPHPNPAPSLVGAAVPTVAPTAPAPGSYVTKSSPAARKRARELGIDINAIGGSGINGAITVSDVERAAAAAASVPTPASPRRLHGFDPDQMRLAIATAMARSKREIPHYYLATTVDMRTALEWLHAYNKGSPITKRITTGVLLVKAAALALREVPELNGFWRDGRAVLSSEIHAGNAISIRGGGLIAPAIHNTDTLPLSTLMQALSELVRRARSGGLRSSEITDSTITFTSLGDRGVEAVFGVIYPPQLALVGFGSIVERAWAINGHVGVHPVVTITLAADHRASDGHCGALYLAAISRLLQTPEAL